MFSLIAMAAAAVSTPALPPRTVMVDGLAVTYQHETRADGTQRYFGTDHNRRKFEFVVATNGRVTGHVGGARVEFRAR